MSRGDIIRGVAEPVRVVGGTARSSSDSREIPELRENKMYPAEVVVTRFTGEAIESDLFWTSRSDLRESGGFLFSRPFQSWHKTIDVCHATHTDQGRGDNTITLDIDAWDRAERAIRADGYNLEMVGDWHSHPRSFDGLPSDTDLSAWLGMLDYSVQRGSSSPVHIGLIYSPGRAKDSYGTYEDWVRPRISGWATHRTGSGRPVCDSVPVRVRR